MIMIIIGSQANHVPNANLAVKYDIPSPEQVLGYGY